MESSLALVFHTKITNAVDMMSSLQSKNDEIKQDAFQVGDFKYSYQQQEGWLPCDGREIKEDDYPLLYERLPLQVTLGDSLTTSSSFSYINYPSLPEVKDNIIAMACGTSAYRSNDFEGIVYSLDSGSTWNTLKIGSQTQSSLNRIKYLNGQWVYWTSPNRVSGAVYVSSNITSGFTQKCSLLKPAIDIVYHEGSYYCLTSTDSASYQSILYKSATLEGLSSGDSKIISSGPMAFTLYCENNCLLVVNCYSSNEQDGSIYCIDYNTLSTLKKYNITGLKSHDSWKRYIFFEKGETCYYTSDGFLPLQDWLNNSSDTLVLNTAWGYNSTYFQRNIVKNYGNYIMTKSNSNIIETSTTELFIVPCDTSTDVQLSCSYLFNNNLGETFLVGSNDDKLKIFKTSPYKELFNDTPSNGKIFWIKAL